MLICLTCFVVFVYVCSGLLFIVWLCFVCRLLLWLCLFDCLLLGDCVVLLCCSVLLVNAAYGGLMFWLLLIVAGVFV